MNVKCKKKHLLIILVNQEIRLSDKSKHENYIFIETLFKACLFVLNNGII